MGMGLARSEETRRDKPVGVVIHAWKQHKETPCVAIFISN
jgi:hypothetical protein